MSLLYSPDSGLMLGSATDRFVTVVEFELPNFSSVFRSHGIKACCVLLLDREQLLLVFVPEGADLLRVLGWEILGLGRLPGGKDAQGRKCFFHSTMLNGHEERSRHPDCIPV
jgi:hypothetical protein